MIGNGPDVLKKRWLYRDSLAPVAEIDADGSMSRFVYGSRRNVPDLVIKASKVYRLFTDQLGSPRLAVNIADPSDVPYRVDYSAFGRVSGIAGASDWIPFGFAGGLHDPDTGLVRFGARDYDSSIGRWVSKDPIQFEADEANLYVYSLNDPINWQDLDGQDPTESECRDAAIEGYNECMSSCDSVIDLACSLFGDTTMENCVIRCKVTLASQKRQCDLTQPLPRQFPLPFRYEPEKNPRNETLPPRKWRRPTVNGRRNFAAR